MEKLRCIKPAFSDVRGDILNIFEGRRGHQIGHVALITSKKGSIRANHYHKEDFQYIYLLRGEFESHCCDVRNPAKRQVLQVKPGDLVETPPFVAHAQKFTKDSAFLALTTRPREHGKYEDDTIAYPVIEGYLNTNLKSESVNPTSQNRR